MAVYNIEICNSPANKMKVVFKWLQSKNTQTKIFAVFYSIMISVIPKWIDHSFSGRMGEAAHLACLSFSVRRGRMAQWLERGFEALAAWVRDLSATF